MASEKSRRRSLFDNDNGGILFYNDSHKSQLPSDYLDKIKIEINQWEQLLQKCGKEDKLEYKKYESILIDFTFYSSMCKILDH